MMQFVEVQFILAGLPTVILGLACVSVYRRRLEFSTYAQTIRELDDAKERGSHTALLQYPDIDLSRCIGCGLCVQACPESGVLELIHGQAVVVHGARCVGHGRCAEACPTSGIALTFGDLSARRDLPAVTEEFEVAGTPGLFLAGEITGFALVRTAINQGVTAATEAARRVEAARLHDGDGDGDGNGSVCDLLIVGAGPGGLACALRAKELGLESIILEQEERLGGTVASYPRRKMVMTQPVDLPLFGRLPKLTYQKEDLVELWDRVSNENGLSIRLRHRLVGVERTLRGTFRVETTRGVEEARTVCLALGRRGTPRKLNVPGEDSTKVAYSLLDAESYKDRRILVVGGGDSAVEAALGLSQQPGNQVTLSYRKHAFFRLKARNEAALERALADKSLTVLYESQVSQIELDRIVLHQMTSSGTQELNLPNDDVFVFAGGIPPFELLEKSGVSFDPKNRPAAVETVDRNGGLLVALTLAFLSTVAMAAWASWHWDYYGLDAYERPGSPLHGFLRPFGLIGIGFGTLAFGLFVWNLTYLIKRSLRLGRFLPGSLQFWMGSHVFTGLFSFLCVLIHAGFTFKNTAGGHALLSLGVVVLAGSIGRYLYAFIPRAANGVEMSLDNVRAQLAALSSDWDRQGRGFGASVRAQIDELVDVARWRPGLIARISTLVRGQIRLQRSLRKLRTEGRQHGIPEDEIIRIRTLAHRSYRLTLQVTHYADICAILSSWRYFHRWLALLMIILVLIHVVTAVRYADIDWGQVILWRGPFK